MTSNPLRKLSLVYRIPKALLIEIWAIIQPVVEISGIKINIDRRLSGRMRRILRVGSYEKEEIEVLATQLSQDDIVMEIGTGIGFLSSYCAKKLGSERVFSYEGSPIMKPHILKTYELNQVSPAFENSMISKESGEHFFYVDKDFYASSSVQFNSNLKMIKVSSKSFNQEVKRINPSFLIVDIEGGEYELFQYANFYNIRKILVEVHCHIIGGERVAALKNMLTQLGFQLNDKLSVGESWFLEKLS